MQDKDTTPSTFSQVFQPILSKNIWSKIHQEIPNADKGIKKLTSQKLVLAYSKTQKASFFNIASDGDFFISPQESSYFIT